MDELIEVVESPVRFAHKKVSSPVAHCSFTTGTGTRDEDPRLNGIAHCLEHMFFKGTKSRSAATINSALEKLGGELNAYTTKEETVVHATVLREHLPKALSLISDMVFNSTFPLQELQKEKEIIMEEISSCKDNPSEQIFEDFDSMLFDGHPLSMPILGTPASVRRITPSEITEFAKRNYHNSNYTLSVVADITSGKLQQLVEKEFGHLAGASSALPDDSPAAATRVPLPTARHRGIKERVVKRRTHQTHCIIGATAYDIYDWKRIPLALLTNILGGPALNSRLNILLRERNPLVYTVDATYTPYRDTGIFAIYFGTDRNNLRQASDIVMKELFALRDKEISPLRLKEARRQLTGQMAISLENGENMCLAMGKSLLVYNAVEQQEQIREKIMKVTASDIMQVASEILCEERLSTLLYQ
ncbi:MAG: insulinase family protein [Bacteroidales bacterium]|nr:insulinase family protein [Bacteroidales bacterium]MDD2425405.1 pitrilysin family protein [Bacteroidales bacterium]